MVDSTIVAKLKGMALDLNAWAIILIEIWLTPDICNGEIKIEGYKLLKADMDSSICGRS